MAYFQWTRNFSGSNVPLIQEFPIATATAIEYGEVVRLVNSKVVAVGTPATFNEPVLGVAAEGHDGATAGRQVGLRIKVVCNPNAVFKVKPTTYLTATGGSTSTFVDSNLGPAINDIYNGGYIKVRTCAAGIPAGTLIRIADFTGSGGTITVATQSYAFASGDTVYLYPPLDIVGQTAYDLNSDGTDIDFESGGGAGMIVCGADPDAQTVEVMFKQHH
ncbi:MAG: hypothetical protein PHU85_13380 [Phycisphaerae bacterium]|nr:hypothetical protein [Phycisphaerae bacterium]